MNAKRIKAPIDVDAVHAVMDRLLPAHVDERDFLQPLDDSASPAERAAHLKDREALADFVMKVGGAGLGRIYESDARRDDEPSQFAQLVDEVCAAHAGMKCTEGKEHAANMWGISKSTADRLWRNAGRATKKANK